MFYLGWDSAGKIASGLKEKNKFWWTFGCFISLHFDAKFFQILFQADYYFFLNVP